MQRIDLIGCGGIGGHVARNLCRFLHSERRAVHVVVVDGDAYEERNRSRMSFTAPENKALLLSCAELAAGGAPQLLFTNLAVASAMLNAFYGLLRAGASYEEVYVDIVKNSVVPVERK